MAQKANHLTEYLVQSPIIRHQGEGSRKRMSESMAIEIGSQSVVATTTLSRDASNDSRKFKHHDSGGFRSLELDDQLTLGKKRFNVNSVSSRPANFEIKDRLYKKESVREK